MGSTSIQRIKKMKALSGASASYFVRKIRTNNGTSNLAIK